jgi:hypothetical protein
MGQLQARSGHLVAALESTREAVSIFRWLMKRHREGGERLKVEFFLARGLDLLCARQRALGQLEQALAASKEAVVIHRDVARRYPGAPSDALANALLHLGAMQLEVGQRDGAAGTGTSR